MQQHTEEMSSSTPVTTFAVSRQKSSTTSEDEVFNSSSNSFSASAEPNTATMRRKSSQQRPSVPPPPVPQTKTKTPQSPNAVAAKPTSPGHQTTILSKQHNGTPKAPAPAIPTLGSSSNKSQLSAAPAPALAPAPAPAPATAPAPAASDSRTPSASVKAKPDPVGVADVTNGSSSDPPLPSPMSYGGQTTEVITVTVNVPPGHSLSGKRLLDIGHQDPMANGSEVKDASTGVIYRRKTNGVYFRLTEAVDCKGDQLLDAGDEILAIAGYQLADMTLDTAWMLFDDYAHESSFTLTVAKAKRGWFDDVISSHPPQVDYNDNEKFVRPPADEVNDSEVSDSHSLSQSPVNESPDHQETVVIRPPSIDVEIPEFFRDSSENADYDRHDETTHTQDSSRETSDDGFGLPTNDLVLPIETQPHPHENLEPQDNSSSIQSSPDHPTFEVVNEPSADYPIPTTNTEQTVTLESEPFVEQVSKLEANQQQDIPVRELEFELELAHEAPPLPPTLPPSEFSQAVEPGDADDDISRENLLETSSQLEVPEPEPLVEDTPNESEPTTENNSTAYDHSGEPPPTSSVLPPDEQTAADPTIDHTSEVDETSPVVEDPAVSSSFDATAESADPAKTAFDQQGERKSSSEGFDAYISSIGNQGFDSRHQVASTLRSMFARSASIEKQRSVEENAAVADDDKSFVNEKEIESPISSDNIAEPVTIAQEQVVSANDPDLLATVVEANNVTHDEEVSTVTVTAESADNSSYVVGSSQVVDEASVNDEATLSDERHLLPSDELSEDRAQSVEEARNDVVDAFQANVDLADAAVVDNEQQQPEVDETVENNEQSIRQEQDHGEQREQSQGSAEDTSGGEVLEVAVVVAAESSEVSKRCSTSIYIELTPDNVDLVRRDDRPFSVTFNNSTVRDLGLGTYRRMDGTVAVADLDKNGTAYRNGNIRTGDVIQSVNGIELAGSSDDELQNALSSATVTLRFATPRYLQSLKDDEIEELGPAINLQQSSVIGDEEPQSERRPSHHKVELTIPYLNAGSLNDGTYTSSDDRTDTDVSRKTSVSSQNSDSDAMTKSRRSVSSDQSVSGILRDYFLPEPNAEQNAANSQKATPATKPIISQALLPKAFRSTTQIQTIGAYEVPTCLLKNGQDQATASTVNSSVSKEPAAQSLPWKPKQSPRSFPSIEADATENDVRLRSEFVRNSATAITLEQSRFSSSDAEPSPKVNISSSKAFFEEVAQKQSPLPASSEGPTSPEAKDQERSPHAARSDDVSRESTNAKAANTEQELKEVPNIADSKAFFESMQRKGTTGPILKPKPSRGNPSVTRTGSRQDSSAEHFSDSVQTVPTASSVEATGTDTEETPSMLASRAFFESLQTRRTSAGGSVTPGNKSSISRGNFPPPPVTPRPKRSDSIGSDRESVGSSVEINEQVPPAAANVGDGKSPTTSGSLSDGVPANLVAESRSLFESKQKPHIGTASSDATLGLNRPTAIKQNFPPSAANSQLKRSDSASSGRESVDGSVKIREQVPQVGDSKSPSTSALVNDEVPAVVVAESRSLFESKQTPRICVGSPAANPPVGRSSVTKPTFPSLPSVGVKVTRSASIGSSGKVADGATVQTPLAADSRNSNGPPSSSSTPSSSSNAANDEVPVNVVAGSRALFEAQSAAGASTTPPVGRGAASATTAAAVSVNRSPMIRSMTLTDGEKVKSSPVPPPTVPKPEKPVTANAPAAGLPASPLRRSSSSATSTTVTSDVVTGPSTPSLRPRPSLSGADSRSKAWKDFMSTYASMNK